MNPLDLLSKNQRDSIIKRLRKQDEKSPRGYDLCLRVNDAYFDVTNGVRGWRLSALGMTLAHQVKTRTECIDILEEM